MLDGIDVHDAQGPVGWATVAAHNQFAFLRGAYGDRADLRYADNYEGCKANKLPCGLYHFFRATQSYQKQADVMCDVLSKIGFGIGDLPAVIDVEDNPHYDGPWDNKNNAAYLKGLQLWLGQIQKTFPNCTPIIYTRGDFWRTLGNPQGFEKYPLWVAHYTSNPQPTLPDGWKNYAFWQYSQSGTAAGVSGGCDMNRFAGDGAQLQALLIGGLANASAGG
jgi:lysozyme